MGSKVLLTTGIGQSEIIDVADPSFQCPNVQQFPFELKDATGGFVEQTVLVCGGRQSNQESNECYTLNQNGDWEGDQSAALQTPRYDAATGSVVINDQLVIIGGYGSSGKLSTIELIKPKTEAKVLEEVELPHGLRSACAVAWNSSTIFVVGGWSTDDFDPFFEITTPNNRTYFIDVNNGRYVPGPSLRHGRKGHACQTMTVQGKEYVIVTGGFANGRDEQSTEILEKSNEAKEWTVSNSQLPGGNKHHQMVASPDGHSVYAINQINKNIYRYSCRSHINTCSWTKSQTQLKYEHDNAIAIPIPDALAYQMC